MLPTAVSLHRIVDDLAIHPSPAQSNISLRNAFERVIPRSDALVPRFLQTLCGSYPASALFARTTRGPTVLTGLAQIRQPPTFEATKDAVRALIKEALLEPAHGERQEYSAHAWDVFKEFDLQRQAGNDCADLDEALQSLMQIAADKNHPATCEAELLHSVLSRPIDRSVSLETFLAGTVRTAFDLKDMEMPPKNTRDFDSFHVSLAVTVGDNHSIGRTLLAKGALAMYGIPSGEKALPADVMAPEIDRALSIQKNIFGLPRWTSAGTSLTFMDFCMQEKDPLEEIEGVYLNKEKTN